MKHLCHVLGVSRIEPGKVEAHQRIAAGEHRVKIPYAGGVEGGEVEAFERPAPMEHPRHVLDVARLEPGQVERLERAAAAEHARHVLDTGRVEARQVEAFERAAPDEQLPHTRDAGRVELDQVAGGHVMESFEPLPGRLRRDAIVDDLDVLDVGGMSVPAMPVERLALIHRVRRPAFEYLALLRRLLAVVEAQRPVGGAIHRERLLLLRALGAGKPSGYPAVDGVGDLRRGPLSDIRLLAALLGFEPVVFPVQGHGLRGGIGVAFAQRRRAPAAASSLIGQGSPRHGEPAMVDEPLAPYREDVEIPVLRVVPGGQGGCANLRVVELAEAVRHPYRRVRRGQVLPCRAAGALALLLALPARFERLVAELPRARVDVRSPVVGKPRDAFVGVPIGRASRAEVRLPLGRVARLEAPLREGREAASIDDVALHNVASLSLGGRVRLPPSLSNLFPDEPILG